MANNYDVGMGWQSPLNDHALSPSMFDGDFDQYHSPYQQPLQYIDLPPSGPYDGADNSNIAQPSYLPPNLNPNGLHMYNVNVDSMAHALPQLESDEVEKVLMTQHINSMEKLSLDQNGMMDTQQLPYMNGSIGSGTMSSGSNGDGSFGNSPFTNGVAVQNVMQNDLQTMHHIEILEEPMEFGYRFRYEVEGKAHGGLQGQSSKSTNSKKGNKIYPEIQVCDVPSNVQQLHIEARLVSATEDYYPHPNKCSGKDCNSRGVYRKILKRNESPKLKLVLGNLTILQIKKGDQKTSLLDQLKDINDNGLPVHRLSDNELEKKAEVLAKAKHNGVVRIRFQASYFDDTQKRWHVAVQHSKPVHDQKQTNAAELRICRVSSASAPATGGTKEIFLLCEKVTKDDIKVKFKHGQWEADGIFQGTDVHYQYAIVFRAPQYKDLHIQKEVKVELMLFRQSTGTYSKPIEFTYHPTATEEEEVARKRKRLDRYGPSDMPGYPPFPPSFNQPPYGPSDDGQGRNGNFQSPRGPYGTSYHGFSRNTSSPAAAHVNPSRPVTDDEKPVNLTKPRHSDSNLPATIDEVESDNVPINLVKDGAIKSEVSTASPAKTDGVKVEPMSDKSDTKNDDDDDLETDFVETKLFTSNLIGKSNVGYKEAPRRHSELELKATPSHGVRTAEQMATTKDALTEIKGELEREKIRVKSLQYHVAVCEDMVIDAVMNYATTGDALYFISQFRHFLAVKDEYGDNSLHMAVINGQYKALKDMLNMCMATKTMPAMNQLNDKHQTALHLATILKNVEMVEVLLKHDANPAIKDYNGNNCFHIAARNGDYKTMELLSHWLRLTCQDKTVVDDFNYEGDAPLHRAVQVDSIECIRELINAGANVNVGDRTSGRTPLHHAIQRCNVVTTAELVLHTKVDVDAQAYDGNSPLHLAISLRNSDLSRMLIKSGADPLIENRDYDRRDVEEREEVAMGMNAYDLCGVDEKMLTTIRTSLIKQTKSPHLVGSIQSLPKDTTNHLSQLLDQDSHDWKRLAINFELSSLVDFMETSGSPTVTLLNFLARDDKTIKDLTLGLITIARLDCVDVIEKWNPSATGRHGSGIVDSGFVDSYVSGNTRSGHMK